MKKRAVMLSFATDEEFARAAATHVGRLARSSIAEKGRFDVALSGGDSPRPVYAALQNTSLFPAKFWQDTHIFFVDERMVDPESPLSNVGNTHSQLLDHVPIPPENIHPMRPAIPEPDTVYAAELATHFKLNDTIRWPIFDLIVLGMGGDGHTASLFPGSRALQERKRMVLTVPAPDQEPRVPRMTLTFGVINAAREVTFWIRGSGKHDLVRDILARRSFVPAASVNAARQSWYICPPLP